MCSFPRSTDVSGASVLPFLSAILTCIAYCSKMPSEERQYLIVVFGATGMSNRVSEWSLAALTLLHIRRYWTARRPLPQYDC